MVPVWIAEMAAAFWTAAELVEDFPRSLRQAIRRAVPLTVVPLPELSVARIRQWLQKFGIDYEVTAHDRPVRACLVARHGSGVAFIEASDSETEQRFSLAHELGHFLREYWLVRTQLSRKVGRSAVEVLDGRRLPTSDERMHALLRNMPLGVRVHLMDRDGAGQPATLEIAEAEQCADRLAYELLAPAEHVCSDGAPLSRPALIEKLRRYYGLPAMHAARYAGLLLPAARVDPLLQRLGDLA